MKKKRKQDVWEEELNAMLEKERNEMELPDSLKPEHIKEKILDYEAGREKTAEKEGGQEGIGLGGNGQIEKEQEESRQIEKTRKDAERKKEKRKKLVSFRQAGIALAAMAAVLVLAVGGRSLVLSRQGGRLVEWNQDSQTGSGAGQEEKQEAEDIDTESGGIEAGAPEAMEPAEAGTDSASDLAEDSVRREDVLVGVQKASSYEELLKIYKEAGIIERQVEEKPGFWDRLYGIFFTQNQKGSAVKGDMVISDEAALDYSNEAMNGGAIGGDMSDGGERAEPEVSMKDSMSSVADSDNALPAETEGTDSDFSGTNVQVAGVDEGDILKTDGTYIYRLSTEGREIYIYRADKENVEKVGSIALPDSQSEKNTWRNWTDMLLYEGRLAVIATVTEYEEWVYPAGWDDGIKIYNEAETAEEETEIIANTDCYPGYGYGWGNQTSRTELVVYDVSDPAAPKKLDTRVQEGNYQDVRMVNGIIYLVSYQANNDWYICNDEDEAINFKEGYIPKVDGVFLPCDRIYLPEKPQTPNCVIITSTDILNSEKHIDNVAILGDATQLYMSNENIYLWQTEYRWWTPYDSNDETTTTIMKYSYQDGTMAAAGTATIKGYLNNSFSMDEYKGNLRVVTTCDVEREREGSQETETTTENQLYVLDPSMQVVGSIENLAEGEYVKSARFFGDIGYFVTFRQTDPLFSVDLSEPDRPKIIGKLKIPGFSEYLHPYGKGLLLGIGQEADETDGGTEGVKLSMFDVSNPANVKEVAKCVVRDADYSNSDAEYNHKAILVSAEKNVIGFSIESGKSTDYEWKNSYEYCLFSYTEGEGFTERITHDFGEWENQYGSRGIYIGDYLYILYGYDRQQIAVYRLSDGADCGVKDFR